LTVKSVDVEVYPAGYVAGASCLVEISMGPMAVDDPEADAEATEREIFGPEFGLLGSVVIFTKAKPSSCFFSVAFLSCLMIRVTALQLSQALHRAPGMIRLWHSFSLQLVEDLERRWMGCT
jgi:hypothetical protein